ncbi:MAG: hypothetical protein ACI9XJ_001306, partial [Marivirga sp.]
MYIKNNGTTETFKNHIVKFLFLLIGLGVNIAVSNAQVTITPANLSNICVDGGYYGLDDITIDENAINDFAIVGANSTREYLRIELPSGFEFKTTAGTVALSTFDDFDTNPAADGPTYTVTATYVEISYIIDAEAVLNSFFLQDFQVRAITAANTGNMTRIASPSGTDAIVNGANIGSLYGSLSSISAPSIST